jgi:hypothetical protein
VKSSQEELDEVSTLALAGFANVDLRRGRRWVLSEPPQGDNLSVIDAGYARSLECTTVLPLIADEQKVHGVPPRWGTGSREHVRCQLTPPSRVCDHGGGYLQRVASSLTASSRQEQWSVCRLS